mmetsp:Transcript_36856/g.104009  ORF Transcript_36856/g.104009 Transcript_36856/m.104009 type:complete len:313 (-) Transcript_36856:2426-3364(-)
MADLLVWGGGADRPPLHWAQWGLAPFGSKLLPEVGRPQAALCLKVAHDSLSLELVWGGSGAMAVPGEGGEVDQRHHGRPAVGAAEAQLRAQQLVEQLLALGLVELVAKHDGAAAGLVGQHPEQTGRGPCSAGSLQQSGQVALQLRGVELNSQHLRHGQEQPRSSASLLGVLVSRRRDLPAPLSYLRQVQVQRLDLGRAEGQGGGGAQPGRAESSGAWRHARGNGRHDLSPEILEQDALVRGVLVHHHQQLPAVSRVAHCWDELGVALPQRMHAPSKVHPGQLARDKPEASQATLPNMRHPPARLHQSGGTPA